MRPIALGRFGSGGRSKNNSSNNSSNDRGAAFRRGRVGSRRVNNSNGRMNSSNNNSSRGLRGRSLRCRNQSSSSNGQVSNGRTNRGNNPLTSALQHTVASLTAMNGAKIVGGVALCSLGGAAVHLSLPQIVHAQQQVKLTADQLAKDLLEDSKAATRRTWLLFMGMFGAGAFVAEKAVAMAGYPGGGIGFAAVVGGSALFQYMFLAGGGGHVVARSMGGRDISKETNHEVVQMVRELAHKANIPCPAVYIIPTQQLNAFAAGMNPKNAVVAVTQGIMQRLNREELKAVIGHEIGHILNGDCKTGTQMAVAIAGFSSVAWLGLRIIQFNRMQAFMNGAAQQQQPRRSSSSKSNKKKKEGLPMDPVLLAGIGIVLLGGVLYCAGNLLKASISREREYAADATAVALCDGQALASALLKISSTAKKQPEAAMPAASSAFYSHLYISPTPMPFFGNLNSLMATHPPTLNRVKAIREASRNLLPAPASPVAPSA